MTNDADFMSVCRFVCVCVCRFVCVCECVWCSRVVCECERFLLLCYRWCWEAWVSEESHHNCLQLVQTKLGHTHTHTHTHTQEAEVLGKPSLDQEQSPLAYLTHTHRNVKTTCRTEPRQTRCNFLRFHRAKTFWVVNPLFIFLFTATYCTGIHISAADSYHALIKVFSCFATQTNTFSLMPAKNLTSYSTIM